MQGLVEFSVAYLLENVRRPGLVKLEGFSAMRAVDFLYVVIPSVCEQAGATPSMARAAFRYVSNTTTCEPLLTSHGAAKNQ